MRVKVVIYEAKEGGYWAQVPAFPACVSEGETLDEVKRNIAEALKGCLRSGSPVDETGERFEVCELDL
jgi:predicted RNase H-like HicB family nuclease